jgi:hypothetical protein
MKKRQVIVDRMTDQSGPWTCVSVCLSVSGTIREAVSGPVGKAVSPIVREAIHQPVDNPTRVELGTEYSHKLRDVE